MDVPIIYNVLFTGSQILYQHDFYNILKLIDKRHICYVNWLVPRIREYNQDKIIWKWK